MEENSENKSVLLCRKPKFKITKKTPVLSVAKQIAYGLYEPKLRLIYDVVEVLGVSVVLDLYYQTSRIQKDGGMLTNEKDRSKTPGGVFLTLVKKTASAEQAQKIFHADKVSKYANRAQKKKRRYRTHRMQTETQTDVIAAQGHETSLKDCSNIDYKTEGHKAELGLDPGVTESLQMNNLDPEDCKPELGTVCDAEGPQAELTGTNNYEMLDLTEDFKAEVVGTRYSEMIVQEELAMQFETMDESQVDFGVELSYD